MSAQVEYQVILNWLGGAICVLGGWFLNNLDRRFRDNEVVQKGHGDKIQAIELLVAGDYVKREDHEKYMAAIFKKLDAIEDKVDTVQVGVVAELNEVKLKCAVVHGGPNDNSRPAR